MTRGRASSSRAAQRAEPREVLELTRLRGRMPGLAEAVDLQLASFDLFRRARMRVPLPRQLDEGHARSALAAGRPVLRFRDVPLNWSDYRWVLRETADLLRRFELIEAETHAALIHLMRDGHRLEPEVERWFTSALQQEPPLPSGGEEYAEIFARALRPFLTRCSEAWGPRLDLDQWQRGICPLCAGAPELAARPAIGPRHLLCERCLLRWPLPEPHCPWCGETRVEHHKSWRTPDGGYLLDACDTCRHYLKVADELVLGRPVLSWVDVVASMPLDAMALQQGYGQ